MFGAKSDAACFLCGMVRWNFDFHTIGYPRYFELDASRRTDTAARKDCTGDAFAGAFDKIDIVRPEKQQRFAVRSIAWDIQSLATKPQFAVLDLNFD